MEGIFGIGIPEILLVFVLALILLGPRDMVGTARKMGRWINRVLRSPLWREIVTTSQELRDLPVKIVREAGIEETMEELKKTGREVRADVSGAVNEVRQAELDAMAQAQAAMHPETQAEQPAATEPVDPQQDTGINPPAEQPESPEPVEITVSAPVPAAPEQVPQIENPPPLPHFSADEPEQPDEYNI